MGWVEVLKYKIRFHYAVGQMAGLEWRQLSDNEKQPYGDMANRANRERLKLTLSPNKIQRKSNNHRGSLTKA